MRARSLVLCALIGCGGNGGGSAGPDAGGSDGGDRDAAVDYGGEVLAFSNAIGIALDDQRVYWAAWLGGGVDAVDKSGGEPVEVVSGPIGSAALVRTGDLLFVSAENDPGEPDDVLWRGSTAGGAGVVVDPAMQRDRLVADGDAVYYLDGSFDLTRVVGEGAPEPITAPVGYNLFDVVGGVVLSGAGDTLEAYDLAGGTTQPLATFTESLMGATMLGTDALALTMSDAPALTLWRLPLAGGEPAAIWTGPGYTYGGVALVVDGDDVYLPILEWPVSGYGAIVRVSTTAGTDEEIATRQPAPTAIALDATHVYWGNRGVSGHVDDLNRLGRVMRAPR